MSTLSFVIIVIFLDFVFVAVLRDMKKGKFEVTSDSANSYRFETNLGSFVIDRDKENFRYRSPNGDGFVLLSYISRVEFETTQSWALLQELFFGFDVTDLFGRYRDSTEYYSIVVTTMDKKQIPVYIASQYHQREFLLGWYIQWQRNLLERLGLFTDGFDHSMAKLEILRDAFEVSGIQMRQD